MAAISAGASAGAGAGGGGGGAGGSGAAGGVSEHAGSVLDYIRASGAPVESETLQGKFGDDKVAAAVNELISKGLIEAFQVNSKFAFQLAKDSTRGLSTEERMVLAEIEKAGDTGVWKKILKGTTGLSEGEMKACIKRLMHQKLIKEVKSVANKSKKIYMAYDLVPSKELTGGPWYTEFQELDHELIEGIRYHVLELIKSGPKSTAEVFGAYVAACDTPRRWLMGTKLKEDDLQSIVDTLFYDGLIEKVGGAGRLAFGSEDVYQIAKPTSHWNALTHVPCGTCPVRDQCQPGGYISPSNCVYLDQWLDF